MIDIEFITAKNPQIRSTFLYQFTYGECKKQVIDRVFSFATGKGFQIREVDYERILPSILEPSF